MTESEELYLLRFRYGRAAEILLAYKTFLNGQINIGTSNYCQTEENARQVSHTLLLVFYSFIYSMFDKNGTDFITASEPYISVLSEEGRQARNDLIETWEKNRTPITKLRNNIGFHGGVKIKSHEVGYEALIDIHPQTSEFIMNQLALFFLELDVIIPPRENYNFHIDPSDARMFLTEKAEKLKKDMDDPTINRLMEVIKKVSGESK